MSYLAILHSLILNLIKNSSSKCYLKLKNCLYSCLKCQFSAIFHTQILNLEKKISVRVLSKARRLLVLAKRKTPRKKVSILTILHCVILNLKKISVRVLSKAKELLLLANYKSPQKKCVNFRRFIID